MLLDVTAFLSSSSTLGIVAEAFVVPENSLLSVVAAATPTAEQASWSQALDAAAARSAGAATTLEANVTPTAVTTIGAATAATLPTTVAATPPDPIIGPQPVTTRVSAAKLPSLRGIELLDQLSLLSGSELSSFVSKHPSTIDTLITHPASASAVASFWAALPRSEQLRMIAGSPKIVGGLEGASYADRDRANRSVLASSEAKIRAQLAGDTLGRAAKDELSKRLHMLAQVRAALKVGSSGNARSLISLDATGEGRAVISVGDASTADYVDYLIPGMFSDVDTQIRVLAGGADSIATQQQAWLKRLNPGVPASQRPTVATLAWIGYQTPNIVNVASMDLARQGQSALTQSISGLRAERAQRVATGSTAAGTQPYIAILAHSYGTTTAMLSLQDDAVSVDALAIVGSPGSPARKASDLNVTDGNVWVGAGETDPVPETGLFGSQPTSAAYGAHRFGVDGATDPLTGKTMTSVIGHDGYFVDGTESMRNMVLIGIGRGDLVLGLDGSSALVLGKAHGTVPRGPGL